MRPRHSLAAILAVLLILVTSNRTSAQIARLDSMDIDETKSELLMHGAYAAEKGSVEVDGVQLTVLDWSDTLVRCTIPSSGKGSAGPVIIQTSAGSTKPRMITKGHFLIKRWRELPLQSPPYYMLEREGLDLHWRADLHSRLLAKVGYTQLYLTPMAISYRGDTMWDAFGQHRDTSFEQPYQPASVCWYLHPFQNGHVAFLGMQWQSPASYFDSTFTVTSGHDTLKSDGKWIGENIYSGEIEWPAPREAVWLMKNATLKYPVINHEFGLVSLQWWRIPWMARYQLQISTDELANNIVFDTTTVDDMTSKNIFEHTTVKTTLPAGSYWWRVRGLNSEGPGVWNPWVFTINGPKSVERRERPVSVHFDRDHATLILTSDMNVNARLRVIDMLGRTIRSEEVFSNGSVTLSDLYAGSYMYLVTGEGIHEQGKLTILR